MDGAGLGNHAVFERFDNLPLLAWKGALALPPALELLVVALAGAALFRLARGGGKAP